MTHDPNGYSTEDTGVGYTLDSSFKFWKSRSFLIQVGRVPEGTRRINASQRLRLDYKSEVVSLEAKTFKTKT